MELLPALLILLAGLGAGTINAVVGSGTLITFPALVAFGVPPVAATMSNAIGLVPGNIASSLGFREELKGQRKTLLRLIPASLLGSVVGAILLLQLPESAFHTIVPILLVFAIILVVAQPALQRTLKSRKAEPEEEKVPGRGRSVGIVAVVFLTAVYGGYFAAAQGIILIGLLALLMPETLQRINGLKNVLVLVVNTVSATIYIIVGFDRIEWLAVLLIAIGSMIGGYFGARFGRRLHPVALRCVIVVLGLVALWRILTL